MEIDAQFNGFTLRRPTRADGIGLHVLVRLNPPLDMNSAYCNVLQCDHFADTCVVAEKEGELVGYVTGYRKPREPHVFFLWQVGVSPAGRGHGLATKMIQAILARDFCSGVTELQTTVTPSNVASRRLFARLAQKEGAEMVEEAEHFSASMLGGKEPEALFRIAPLSTPKGAR